MDETPVEGFVKSRFNVVTEEGEQWVKWDEGVKTMYVPFTTVMFSDVIADGISLNHTDEEIFMAMCVKSITVNYGLTEYIVRHASIPLF